MKEEPITTVRKTVHLTTDSIKALEARNGTDLSKEIRHAIDAYLDVEVTTENINIINGVIHQELEVQIKALGNWLAAMLNRLTIISAAGYYANIAIISDLIDTDRYSSFEKIESIARKKALAYANTKSADALKVFTDDEETKKAVRELKGGTPKHVDFDV